MSEARVQDEVHASSGVAIIGLACRFPGAANFRQYWENLRAGKDCTTTFSEEVLKASGVSARELSDPNYVRVAGVMDGEELFDANFFNISPREASAMDPQHRIFLEMAWEALEHAGYGGGRGAGLVGVYGGASFNSYLLSHVLRQSNTRMVGDDFQTLMGNEQDYLTTRVSYRLNLRGPSVTVQTACSTSLVAVHMACESILGGECDLALAGGVAVNIPQRVGFHFSREAIFSADGRCRAFDADAAGTVPGSGAGIVVLKRLDEALAHGDCIHAIIRGSAVNNDGSSKVGYTSPSVEGQRDVVLEALASAAIDPATISYVEAHGTATPLGDPIEVQALTEAYRRSTPATGFCGIGSVKTNIGHLNTASGIAGLLKVVAALEHRELPPSLYFRAPNPKIDFKQTPFHVVSQLQPWQGTALPRRAAVSSFGIGGTNAHIILEEAPVTDAVSSSVKHHAIVLSAKSGAALEAATRRLLQFCADSPETCLADIAYTLQQGRSPMRFRRAFLAATTADIGRLLGDPAGKMVSGEAADHAAAIRLFFPGEGGLTGKAIRQLMDGEALFADALERCVESAKAMSAVVRLPAEDEVSHAPWLLVSVQYSLAQLLTGWGVRPQALSGCGNGLLAAAIVADVMRLEAALAVALGGRDVAAPELSNSTIPVYDLSQDRWLAKGEFLTAAVGRAAARDVAGKVFPGQLGSDPILEVGPQGCWERAANLFAIIPAGDVQVRADQFVLSTLLALWVNGAPVELSKRYATESRRRIPLPSYPFERAPYWWEATATRRENRSRQPDEMFWIPSWKQDAPAHPVVAQTTPATWLIVADEQRIVQDFERRLRGPGSTLIRVSTGQKFEQREAFHYVVRLRSADDYGLLWDSLADRALVPDFVIHLLNWGDQGGPDRDLEGAVDRAFNGLCAIAKSLDRRPQRPKRIAVISSDAVQIAGEGSGDPVKAMLRGACSALRDDVGLDCVWLDFPRPEPGSRWESRLIDQILLEVRSEHSAPLVAWRGSTRWLRAAEPLRLPRPSGVPSRLRVGGVYLLTGGLGGIGLAVAKYLASSIRARMVLVTRRGIEEAASDLAVLDEIRSLGGEIELAQADVSKPQQLRAAFELARRRFGALHGVFHAAGLAGSGHVRESADADVRDVLAPKVAGTLALGGLADEYNLDFLLLFSSTVALTGAPHQSAYCAANAFLDAYAERQAFRSAGTIISVNWDRWRNVGIGKSTAEAETIVIGPNDWRLNEHRVAGARAFPGAGYLDLVARLFRREHPGAAVAMRQVSFTQLLKVDDANGVDLGLTLRKSPAGEHHFRVTTRDGTRTHVAGMISSLTAAPQTARLEAIRERCAVRTIRLDRTSPQTAPDAGYQVGPRWRSLRSVWVGQNEALAELLLSDEFHADLPLHPLHPALLDVATSFYTHDESEGYHVPIFFQEMRVHAPLPPHIYAHAAVQPEAGSSGRLGLDITIMDRDGSVLVQFSGFSFSRVLMTSAQPPDHDAVVELGEDARSRGISQDEGIECLARLLHHSIPPRLIVTPADLTQVNSSEQKLAGPEASVLHPRPDLPNAYVPPGDDTERSIAQVFMVLLGLQRIGINDDFLDLGADSTIFMEAVLSLYDRMGIVITPEQFYEYSTIAKLAQSPMARNQQVSSGITNAAADNGKRSVPPQPRADLDPQPEELEQLRKLFGN
jgi:acyl transferase domain-containing protein